MLVDKTTYATTYNGIGVPYSCRQLQSYEATGDEASGTLVFQLNVKSKEERDCCCVPSPKSNKKKENEHHVDYT